MASSYLSQTVNATATNKNKITVSVWLKRCKTGAENTVIGGTMTSNNRWKIRFRSDDKLDAEFGYGGSWYSLITNRTFTDTSGWYHLVYQYDSTQGTASERAKLWINGVQETSFSTANYPPQNYGNYIVENTAKASVGTFYDGSGYHSSHRFDGYLSHVAVVDGTIYAPTSFGSTDSTSGIWKFKNPSGLTWGNNGFHLKFENSGNLGLDSSGQSNNFTTNGDVKQSLDTPSNVHSVWNVSNPTLPPTVRYGNTEIYTNANSWRSAFTTLGANTGKWYMEMKWGGGSHLTPGFSTMNVPSHNPDFTDIINAANNGGYPISLYTNGVIYENGSNEGSYGSGTSFSVNDIIMLAMDLDNNKLYWGKNGTWFNSANPAGNTGGYSIDANYTSSMFGFAISVYNTTAQCNFGDGFFGTTAIASAGSNGNGSLFEYDVPSGFYALNTNNINTYG
jgi:hypothetical protein